MCLHNLFKWNALMAICVGTLMVGCVDKNYDLEDVDLTIGVGTDQLVLPNNNSTMAIQLDDILDIDGSDIVFIAGEDNVFGFDNGDYYVYKEGNDIKTSRPEVDPFTVEGIKPKSIDMHLDLSSYIHTPAKGQHAQRVSFPLNFEREQTVVTFFGSSDKNGEKRVPKEVVELNHLDITETLTMTVDFTVLNGIIDDIKEATLKLPTFFTMSNVRKTAGTCSVSTDTQNNYISLTDIKTKDVIQLQFSVTGLNVARASGIPEDGEFAVFIAGKEDEKGTVALGGQVDMGLAIDTNVEVTPEELNSKDFSDFRISVGLVMSDIVVTSATGKFNPEINLTDMGSIDIDDVPDFLSDNDVSIDLYNPQLYLVIDNNTDIDGYVVGKLTAEYEDGTAPVSVSIPEISIPRSKESKICICRNTEGVDQTKYQPVIVPNLTDIVKKMPKRISFSAESGAKHGDDVAPSTFRLGPNDYYIAPSYEFVTPLAFAEDAVITYSDSIDDINGDLDDVELSKDATITLTANVKTQLPLFLNFEAHGVDVNGNDISSDDLEFNVECNVDASDGSAVKEGKLKVVASQKKSDALKRLDAIAFTAKASAAKRDDNGNITEKQVGVRLNAYNQTIQLTDIELTLKGRVIYDANDEK